MLLNPIRVGLGSVIRPGRSVGEINHDVFVAEAKFCRAWLKSSGAIADMGDDNIKVPLFQFGVWVTAQGAQSSSVCTRYFLDMTTEAVMDPLRLLRATGTFVLPTHSTIRVLATAEDVTHSWAVPGLGIKLDCVPGRLFVSFIRLNREGVYYGQCSELCGWNHYNMPIVLYALVYEHFLIWWELELHANFSSSAIDGVGPYNLLNFKYK
jgi:heme/copper-type cytochrome/quinol oxidase subunit 2